MRRLGPWIYRFIMNICAVSLLNCFLAAALRHQKLGTALEMQQLLAGSPLAGLNPAQLQQLVQQNRDNAAADSGRKQLEQLIPQLQAGLGPAPIPSKQSYNQNLNIDTEC